MKFETIKRVVTQVGTAVAVQVASLAVSTAVVTIVNRKVSDYLGKNKEDKCCKGR